MNDGLSVREGRESGPYRHMHQEWKRQHLCGNASSMVWLENEGNKVLSMEIKNRSYERLEWWKNYPSFCTSIVPTPGSSSELSGKAF